MALGKPSKKTTKTASEPKAKPVSSGARSKVTQAVSGLNGDVAEATAVKTRKKSAAVVNIDSNLADVVTMTPEAPAEKTLAAAAGSSLVIDTPPISENAVSVAHSAAPVNGVAHTASPEAIAELAYSYWAERGYAHGFAEEDWARAEAALKNGCS